MKRGWHVGRQETSWRGENEKYPKWKSISKAIHPKNQIGESFLTKSSVFNGHRAGGFLIFPRKAFFSERPEHQRKRPALTNSVNSKITTAFPSVLRNIRRGKTKRKMKSRKLERSKQKLIWYIEEKKHVSTINPTWIAGEQIRVYR